MKKSNLANNLRDLRLNADLSQMALAIMSGVPLNTISLIERGRTRSPNVDVLIAIAEKLDVTLDELITGE